MQDVGETPPAPGDRRELESEIETLQTDICDYLNHLPEQLLASDRAIQTMTEEFISLGVIAQTDQGEVYHCQNAEHWTHAEVMLSSAVGHWSVSPASK
ncbi:hypothetical protein HDU89_007963 [Geranomyces variabilis]|nr:hypothetical protein HDU89_007963 [Geranomyces variabilis]